MCRAGEMKIEWTNVHVNPKMDNCPILASSPDSPVLSSPCRDRLRRSKKPAGEGGI